MNSSPFPHLFSPLQLGDLTQISNKARNGQVDDIRACIACNQACIGHFHAGYPISCIQNPVSGRELIYRSVRPAARQRRIVVIGGGPGGMKAAAVAAERGHDVTLFERESQLGGQARLAQQGRPYACH